MNNPFGNNGDGNPEEAAPKVQIPPLRIYVVRAFDPITQETTENTYGGHLMLEKESGTLVIVEMQFSPVHSQMMERVVQYIPSGEWDRAWEVYPPTPSTIIH